MPADTVHMIVRGIPPRLKGKIAKRVDRLGSNFNEVTVGVLCDHYGIPFTPQGRRSPREIGLNPNPVLDVPAELKRRIDHEMIERQESQRNVVVEILAAEFNEPFVPTGRWRGHVKRERASAA